MQLICKILNSLLHIDLKIFAVFYWTCVLDLAHNLMLIYLKYYSHNLNHGFIKSEVNLQAKCLVLKRKCSKNCLRKQVAAKAKKLF